MTLATSAKSNSTQTSKNKRCLLSLVILKIFFVILRFTSPTMQFKIDIITLQLCQRCRERFTSISTHFSHGILCLLTVCTFFFSINSSGHVLRNFNLAIYIGTFNTDMNIEHRRLNGFDFSNEFHGINNIFNFYYYSSVFWSIRVKGDRWS